MVKGEYNCKVRNVPRLGFRRDKFDRLYFAVSIATSVCDSHTTDSRTVAVEWKDAFA